jgi:hypothetical protein
MNTDLEDKSTPLLTGFRDSQITKKNRKCLSPKQTTRPLTPYKSWTN